ncbi:MAG: metallophosphoesterase family protein [Deltaproteobacteria bacterium]|nr:metallophosphoesterase family protein [Deltaproteobacteria bacterium]
MINATTIAIVSDTHGMLPHFVVKKLQEKSIAHIIHAGDICGPKVISELRRIAPVTCVRGNMDAPTAGNTSELVEVNGFLLYVLHNLYDIDIDPRSAGVHVVIHGHLHRPSIEWKNEILYLNPGSCSYPRGHQPPSFALIETHDKSLQPEIIYQ